MGEAGGGVAGGAPAVGARMPGACWVKGKGLWEGDAVWPEVPSGQVLPEPLKVQPAYQLLPL